MSNWRFHPWSCLTEFVQHLHYCYITCEKLRVVGPYCFGLTEKKLSRHLPVVTSEPWLKNWTWWSRTGRQTGVSWRGSEQGVWGSKPSCHFLRTPAPVLSVNWLTTFMLQAVMHCVFWQVSIIASIKLMKIKFSAICATAVPVWDLMG